MMESIAKNTAWVTAMLLASAAFAQNEKHPYDIAKEAFDKQTAAAKEAAKGNADLLVLDHVEADRKARRVTIHAVATGVAESDPVEFFVAPLSSGKDYESLTITYAKPSDVDQALRFIGLTPGRPVNYEKNLQWPRGPRVTMTFVDGEARTPAEDCVINTEANAPPPRTGMVYVGSFPQTDPDGKPALAADIDEAKPIAPLYNDPAALLDVPARSPQGVVYGFVCANPKHAFPLGRQIKIVLEPATGDLAVRNRDLLIRVAPPGGSNTYTIEEGGKPVSTSAELPGLVNLLAEQSKTRDDLFCVVDFDPNVPVAEARKLYAVLVGIEQDRGIKLDPPAVGLFHKAYFPEPEWRQREGRLGEPWELFLYRDGGKLSGRLERVVENYDADAPQKTMLQRKDVADPAAFVSEINAGVSQWTKAVFVYPPADLTVGELNAWALPALPTYGRIFVFPAVAPATQPTTRP